MQTFTNSATGKAWTPVDMFIAAVSNSAAYPPRQNFTDVSGLARWPQDPFVQPLRQSYTALPSPQPSLAPPQTSRRGATQCDRPARAALYSGGVDQLASVDAGGDELESDRDEQFHRHAGNQPVGGFYRLSTP